MELFSIDTGSFRLDGGGMFGVVPRVLWERYHRPDERNRIEMAMRVLLIRGGDRNILVDTGAGNYHSEGFIDRYAIEKPGFTFGEGLRPFGLGPEDITDVVITHLHFDHAGGMIEKSGSGLVYTFPEARIWLQREQWEWARHPSVKDKASFLPGYMQMLGDYSQLELMEGKGEIAAGVWMIPFYGHTAGMQGVLIEGAGKRCFYASDLIPLGSHLHVPYIMAYDNHPVTTAQEKEKILERAAAEQWVIYFEHDPVYAKGTIEQKDGRYVLGE